MNIDAFPQYLKDHLLEARQILAHVGDFPRKLAIRDKTEPLSFQKVGLENEQPGVSKPRYFIVPFGIGKDQTQHVLLYLEE
jgi:hypothetical protein